MASHIREPIADEYCLLIAQSAYYSDQKTEFVTPKFKEMYVRLQSVI